jgi:hypothetical protein
MNDTSGEGREDRPGTQPQGTAASGAGLPALPCTEDDNPLEAGPETALCW